MIRALGALALLLASAASAQEAAPSTSLVGPGVRVADIDRAIAFYTNVFGTKLATKLQHGTLTEAILCFDPACRGAQLLLLRDSAPGKSPPLDLGNGFAKIVVRVTDIAGVADRLKAAGLPAGPIQDGPRGYRILNAKDPDGYAIEIIQPGAPRG